MKTAAWLVKVEGYQHSLRSEAVADAGVRRHQRLCRVVWGAPLRALPAVWRGRQRRGDAWVKTGCVRWQVRDTWGAWSTFFVPSKHRFYIIPDMVSKSRHKVALFNNGTKTYRLPSNCAKFRSNMELYKICIRCEFQRDSRFSSWGSQPHLAGSSQTVYSCSELPSHPAITWHTHPSLLSNPCSFNVASRQTSFSCATVVKRSQLSPSP